MSCSTAKAFKPLSKIAIDAVAPHLKGTSVASLSKDRILALAKLTALPEATLATLAAAHKTAFSTGLPSDVLFALSENGAASDPAPLASYKPAELRNKVKSAIKIKFIPAETLATFDAAKSILAPLQTHENPLSTLVKMYELGVSDSLLKKLDAKNIRSLAQLRAARNPAALAKILKVKANHPQLAGRDFHLASLVWAEENKKFI
jgi:hypothetical protein